MPSPYRTLRVALVLLVAGIALFNSAKWVMLSGDSAVAMGVTYTSRFTGVAAYFIIAILFRTHLPSMKNILTVLGIFAGLYVVSTILVLFTGTGEFNNVISYATAVLYGIATALFFLLYAHAFSTQGPKKSAVLFAVAQLVTNCFMMLFSIIEPQALIVTRLVFLVIGPVLLIISIMMLLKVSDRVEAAAAEKHDVKASKASKGVSAKPAKTADAADAAETAPESGDVVPLQYPGEDDAPLTESELSPETLATTRFPRKPLDWALLISAGFVFSTVFGIIAQLSSSPGSSFGLYDSGTGIVLIMVDLLLVLFMYYVGESFTFATALLIIFLFYGTGLVLYPISGGSGTLLAGALIRGGFDVSNVLLWTIVARKVYERPARSFFYFGIFRGVSTVYIGRALGSLLVAGNSAYTLMTEVPAISLWAIGVFAVIAFYLASEATITLPFSSAAAKWGTGSAAEEVVVQQVDEFTAKIEAFSARLDLSEREREVLTETLHGQSRAGVAAKLYLSPDTVKYHLSRIYLKAGVNSRQELVAQVEKEPVN